MFFSRNFLYASQFYGSPNFAGLNPTLDLGFKYHFGKTMSVDLNYIAFILSKDQQSTVQSKGIDKTDNDPKPLVLGGYTYYDRVLLTAWFKHKNFHLGIQPYHYEQLSGVPSLDNFLITCFYLQVSY